MLILSANLLLAWKMAVASVVICKLQNNSSSKFKIKMHTQTTKCKGHYRDTPCGFDNYSGEQGDIVFYFKGTREHWCNLGYNFWNNEKLLLRNKGTLCYMFREQGNMDPWDGIIILIQFVNDVTTSLGNINIFNCFSSVYLHPIMLGWYISSGVLMWHIYSCKIYPTTEY